MDRRVTPPKRGTSPTWGPPPPCKQALIMLIFTFLSFLGFYNLSRVTLTKQSLLLLLLLLLLLSHSIKLWNAVHVMSSIGRIT